MRELLGECLPKQNEVAIDGLYHCRYAPNAQSLASSLKYSSVSTERLLWPIRYILNSRVGMDILTDVGVSETQLDLTPEALPEAQSAR